MGSKSTKTVSSQSRAASLEWLSGRIQNAKKILISTHALPDGDGLGAQLALYHYLKKAKKNCRVLNPDRLPKRFRFLDPDKKILKSPQDPGNASNKLWPQFDLWIICDTNDPRRLGPLWQEGSVKAQEIVFLDHHPTLESALEGESKFSYPPHASIITDTTASSIGELLYQLFHQLNFTPINRQIAIGLYVSVMTDTNSFRYSKTTGLAHQIAAETIELGINPEEIYQMIYSSKEVSHLRLLGELLTRVQVASKGKIAWIEMDRELRKSHRASSDDTLSFTNLLLLIKDAEIVCFFREEDDHLVRVSLKSKGKYIINQVAMEFGGGGHHYAAGFALSAPLNKTVRRVIDRLKDIIDDGAPRRTRAK